MTTANTLPLWEAYRLYTTDEAYTFEPTTGGQGAKGKEILTVHRSNDEDASYSIGSSLADQVKSKAKATNVYGEREYRELALFSMRC